jgi:inner membrane protein
MPSPVGHFIGGVAAGWLIAGAPPVLSSRPTNHPRAPWREVLVFGVLGMIPDLDLIGPVHRGPSHSLTAALAVGAVAWLIIRVPATLALAAMAAYASHILLDWLGQDTSAPFGIMALWPASRAYFESGLNVFLAISRRYYQGWPFIRANLVAVFREVAILGSLLAIIVATRRRQSRTES